MSIIKSYSVGNWDMFTITHDSSNFTIIDCNLETQLLERRLVADIQASSREKKPYVHRFISTHPDMDHLTWLKYLSEHFDISNFYCVDNSVSKVTENEDYKLYKSMRSWAKDWISTFHLYKNCSRKYKNQSWAECGSAWIYTLRPDRTNEFFLDELNKSNASSTHSPNNLSPIIYYREWDISAIRMWDMSTEYMNNIIDKVDIQECNILFAPHHWRATSKVPRIWLDKMNPEIVVIWEASSEDIWDSYTWYDSDRTITQNSAEDITFYLEWKNITIHNSNENYVANHKWIWMKRFSSTLMDYVRDISVK